MTDNSMSMASVSPLLYSLEESCPVPWAETAEIQLHHDYPFLNQDDSCHDFVIQRYLETLWLPESFNPISRLISSLRRIIPLPSKRPQPHPLHFLLRPLLLSTRAASDKYRTELVQILENGGGAGEQEEMVMWYAWEHEKADNEGEGNTDEEKWRKSWLERLERRETMIQIMLNMLKLSLPGPKPPGEQKKTKRRKTKNAKLELPAETDEARLESYMDKIVVWQLTETLDANQPSSQSMSSNRAGTSTERHWTQAFFEDIVEPLFKAELPEQCELFRSKLFPESPFSDIEESDAESLLNGRASRAGSRVPSVATSAALELQRSRSRSLSVSLAQDEASQRANFLAPKSALSREVSMSRVFKEKPKAQTKLKAPREKQKANHERPKIRRDMGRTLIEETPVKRRSAGNEQGGCVSWMQQSQAQFAVPSPPPTSSSEPGDIHIEDTPVATCKRQTENEAEPEDALSPLTPVPGEGSDATTGTRPSSLKVRGKNVGSSIPPYRLQHSSGRIFRGGKIDADLDENAEDTYMEAFKSSNVMLLGRCSDRAVLGDEDVEMATPTKRRSRKK